LSTCLGWQVSRGTARPRTNEHHAVSQWPTTSLARNALGQRDALSLPWFAREVVGHCDTAWCSFVRGLAVPRL